MAKSKAAPRTTPPPRNAYEAAQRLYARLLETADADARAVLIELWRQFELCIPDSAKPVRVEGSDLTYAELGDKLSAELFPLGGEVTEPDE